MPTTANEIGLVSRLAKRLFPLTLAIGVIIAVGLPAAYYVHESDRQRRTATVYARTLSEKVGSLVLEAPALWKYQTYKYPLIVQDFLAQKDVVRVQILDEGGRPIAGAENVAPEVRGWWWDRQAAVGSAPLLFNNRKVGTIRVGVTLGPMLREMFLLFLLSSAIGAGLAFLVHFYQRSEERAEKLRVLNTLTRLITSATESRKVLNGVAEAATTLLGARMARVWVADPAARVLRPQGSFGIDPRLEALTTELPAVPFGKGVVGEVFDSRVPEYLADIGADSRWLNPRLATEAHLRAFAGIPLVTGDRVAGVLAILCGDRRHFSLEEKDLMALLADQAAIAIENAHLYEGSERRRRSAEALAAVGRDLTQSLEPAEVAQRISDTIREILCLGYSRIYRLEPESEDLVAVAMSGGTAVGLDQKLIVPRGMGAVGLAVRERCPVVSADVFADPRITFSPEVRARMEQTFRAVLAVPLIVKGVVIGAVVAGDLPGRVFNAEQIQLAQAFADQAAIAIENAQLYEEAQRRLRETRALLEMAQVFSSTLELKPLLKEVAQRTAQAVGVERCSINLWSDGHVVPVMSQFADGHTDQALWEAFKAMGPYRIEEVPAHALAIEQRGPVVVEDVPSSELWPAYWRETFGQKSALVVPLIRRDEVVGTMSLDHSTAPRPFTEEQIRLAMTIASQMALAVDNARLYEETQRRLRETGGLLSVAQSLGASLDPQEISRQAAREITHLLGADTSIFFQVDEAGTNALAVSGYHVPKELWDQNSEQAALPELPPLVLQDFRRGQPVASADVSTDPRLDHPAMRSMPVPLRSLIGVPVVSHGRPVGALLSFWWSKPHRFTEEELRLAAGVASQMALALDNAGLYKQVQQALADLQTAQDQLVQSEKLGALGQMAGGVAHDFNNLLAAILGRTQHLLLRLAEGAVAPEEARRSLGVIERAALDGKETVRRLLEFTRATPRLTEAEAVDVPELLASVVAASQPRWKDEAEARGAHIEVVQDVGEVPPVLGNASDLREVVLNLVFNAIEAMPAGGTLTLSSWAEGGSVWLAVKDTGVGIPEEIRSRIFDPFFTTKGVQSSGLGLSVSYGIIRRHGGEITVDSLPGQGTTFTIRLPLREAPAPPREVAPRPVPAGLRVLVVDDDGDVREALRDLLRAVGHEVFEAGSGPEGLAILEGQEVELVCTDLGMPGMTGWEVAERVKARWPGLAVALVTGWGAGVEEAELQAHGVDFLLTKPFELNEIRRVLSEVARSRSRLVRQGAGAE